MGNDADADDALQDTLIAIARAIRRFDGRSAFSTWSHRVATNACLDELRRRRRRPVPGALGVVPDAGDAHGPAVVPLSEPDVQARFEQPGRASDRAIDSIAGRFDIDAALARLPVDFRVAVVLRDLCDLDYAEIGRVLDIPPGTVRSRIARGRALLTDLLGNPATSPDRPTSRP